MPKTYVELKGEIIDIQDLLLILNDKNWSIDLIENKYLLTADIFETINGNYEILLRAKQFLDILNGVASIIYINHIYVTTNAIYRLDENNKLQGIGFLEGNINCRFRFKATITKNVINGKENLENKYQKWIDKSKSESEIREILHYFNNQNWWNLYKIYEIINNDLKKTKIVNLVSKNQLTRFKQTANDNKIIGESARHATYNNESIKNPMDINSARMFIIDYFEKWIETKL